MCASPLPPPALALLSYQIFYFDSNGDIDYILRGWAVRAGGGGEARDKLEEENVLVSALRHKENPKNPRRDTSWLWLTQETKGIHESKITEHMAMPSLPWGEKEFSYFELSS